MYIKIINQISISHEIQVIECLTSMNPMGAFTSSATPLFKASAAALEFSVSILLI
jgi:hypothetical protein